MLGKAPLWEALQGHLTGHGYPLHVPGHKQGRGLPPEFTERIIKLDLTELPGLDNLLQPTDVLLKAENLARDLAGSNSCYFTTNGSSAGLIAALLGSCSPGDTILLPRNAHLACLHACVLGDLRPVFADVTIDTRLDVVLGVDPADLTRQLEKHADVKVALVVNPSYQGICGDLAAIAGICSKKSVPLIVDEAHGTHFLLGAPFPQSGLYTTNTAAVVQSVHKTGLAMTGAAWIHVRQAALADRIKQGLRLVQSTSPSYALLASLDLSRSIMAERGDELGAQARSVAAQVRDMFNTYTPASPWGFDPLKVILNARAYGISGYQLEAELRRGGIVAETADATTTTLVISLADGEEAVLATRNAQQWLKNSVYPPGEEVISRLGMALPPLGEQLITPRQAYFASPVWVAIEQSSGLIAGDPIIPFPPGIPLVWPGQRIDAHIIEYVLRATALGASIAGVSQGKVRVLK